MIDQQSQQRINEAAEQFTDALVNSYKVVADSGVSAQERNTQLTEVFFNEAINNLHAQAEQNRHATQQLADQQQRRRRRRRSPGSRLTPTWTLWTRCSPGGRGAYRRLREVPGRP
jgi:hypothetical protein